ncbi:methionine--tRNA ligase [Flavobacteriaceae bacterium]|uniref:methionine--tRNA ligase n=1 Tax=Candidatus Arcticimaribacter forsetii TaxID=2820661 RepID=UPI00231FDDBF|nr:methionine--tRNA ligase [Candidatus Arcticimaribacter forsetii]MDA8640029.1 methionine--tRNA ligase [Flavobacteriaceae bacterium]MDA8699305.1 methionine--tRNA ligase [Flavobacteriaceae bacterium]MDB2326066.1 methionine--tRNA ligase [Flavobacteriaceae bacterium]MDB2329470.1 methionine--tRNA ligase [Flavobacteriaceae bacterium]MDB2345530.1 methionine--tRNA ligase [Flavobacteriaceae bacterium]
MKNYTMALSAKRYTITAALPYTNGPIHIGHLAGVYVPADIYSRYLRAQQKDVAFICGSDEHGVAISIKAKKEGVTPKEIIDKYDGMIRKSFDQLGISFDNYSRTSAKIHHETASEIFSKMNDDNKFIEEITEQLYDPEAEQYLADRFVIGTCPKCNHTEAYGDQCEQCGSSLSATELINPKSTLSGADPILKETKHWFLPLDQYESFMKEWVLEGHKNDWKPNVYGQVKSWIDDGLRPRAVTRDLDWGIPVPVEGADGKVLYVWFDAPIGYISSTKEWAQKNNKDWEPYWKDKETELVHFIGKDNIVFHCIIFPCILKATGEYILPENVPANEFLNLEGNKISTSKNWAVWLHEYLEEFPGQEDVLRYVLTANAPETKDNDFTWKDFQTRNNSELVAIFGNFINRVSVLTQKYYEGIVPARKNLTKEDEETLEKMKAFPAIIGNSIERYRFREASQELINLARLGNKYLADQEPWKLIKTDPERVETIMNIALQIAAALATVSEPFLPKSAEKLRSILNISNAIEWNEIAKTENLIIDGHCIGSQELLFAKVEDATIEAQLNKLEATKKTNTKENFKHNPVKENISFDDFSAMDLRTGTVLEAEKIKKTKKLLKLTVDLGFEKRTIVSGIAESYTPEEMIGKKVTVLANLAARNIKGVESQGMLLMTQNKDGKLIIIGPEDQTMDNGFEIN